MFADFAKQRFVLKKGTTKSDRNGSPLARSGQAWVKGGKRIILMVKKNTTGRRSVAAGWGSNGAVIGL